MKKTEPEEIDRRSVGKRPDAVPIMRQNWGKLLFMHWPMPVESLRPLIPRGLTVDTFEGEAWVGVVPFTMWGVRASFLPPVPGTDEFHELNVRTYVHYKGVPGVWFLSMDASSSLAVWGARTFYFLPYFKARMSLKQTNRTIIYDSHRTDRRAPDADFKATWTFGEELPTTEPGSLEFFLTERYRAYTSHRDKIYCARVHHRPWPLCRAELSSCESNMLEALDIPTPAVEPLLHYTEAISVDIWPMLRASEKV